MHLKSIKPSVKLVTTRAGKQNRMNITLSINLIDHISHFFSQAMSDPLREAQKELDEIDLLVAGGSAIESMLHDDTSTDGDNDGVDAENIAAGLKDVELEANRAHQCADHGK